MLRDGRPIYGHVIGGYWSDIGNLQQYMQANYDALSRRGARGDSRQRRFGPACGSARTPHFARGRMLHGPVCIGRNVTIEAGAVVEELSVDRRLVDRRGECAAASDDCLGGRLRRRRRVADGLHARRPRDRQRPRVDHGGRRDRPRQHARERLDGALEHQAVAR